MGDTLFELQQKVAMKPALEAKLRELQNQRREYDREVISLRVAFRKEQEDDDPRDGVLYKIIAKFLPMSADFEGEKFIVNTHYSSGSTDMGDLSCIMPVVQPYAPGASGTSHGDDFYITDPELACIKNAKWQLAMIKLLLENHAERANKIISDFKPMFVSKEEYLAYVESLASSGDRIVYGNDGTATVKLD